MSYVKNTWSDGDVITAVKINNIEDGIAANDANISQLQTDLSDLTGGNLILTTATETVEGKEIMYLTHKDGSIATWREIHDALIKGLPVPCMMIYGTSPLQPKLRGSSGGGEVPADLYYVDRYNVTEVVYATDVEPPSFEVTVNIGGHSALYFSALTADDRLEA